MPEPPTIEALLASVLAVSSEQAEGWTTDEMAQRAGLSVKTVRERLRRLQAQNRLSMATVYRPALNGRMVPVPVYRLKATA